MCQKKRIVIWFIAIAFLASIIPSCQNTSGRGLFIASKDSAMTEEPIHQPASKKLLLDTWDSLNRNQIKFTVDSLNPINIKVQKKNLRDSLRKEFNKYPKHIFLTFDDGPLVGSAAIDSLATAKNIKINTFMVGRHANMSKSRKKDYERYMNNPLVACYNHSYTHAFNRFLTFYSDPQKAFDDFQKNQDDLQLTKKIARLPGRNIWIFDNVRHVDLKSGASTADMLFQEGYKIYGWDIEWRINSITGVPVQSFQEVFNRIQNFASNKSSLTPNNVVVLMHDDMFQTKKGQQLLAQLIDSLKSQDYKFEFIEDYPIKY